MVQCQARRVGQTKSGAKRQHIKDSLLRVKHFRWGMDWIFKAWGSIPPMVVMAGRGCPTRPLVHRQDEPTRLSLGMVASQQSPLPFHLVRRL